MRISFRSRTNWQTLLMGFLFFALSIHTSAQIQTGTPSFGSFTGGPEVIDLANLNVQLVVPVLHKPGRGLEFDFDLAYNSLIWQGVTSNGTTTWQPINTGWGWTNSTVGYMAVSSTFQVLWCVPKTSSYTLYRYSWTYYDGFGTPHKFPGTSTRTTGCQNNTTTLSAITQDGTGYSIVATGGTLTKVVTSTGSTINPTTGVVNLKDRNGNEISTDGSGNYYDTLSSTTPVLTTSTTGTPPTTTYSYAAPSGGAASFIVKRTAFVVQTNFGCSGITEYGPITNNLISEIDLPDGSKYLFDYENTPNDTHTPHYRTGRLASVTFPTGGTITYSYSGGSNGINCTFASPPTLTRVTPDGTWIYVNNPGTTTVTDPLDNQTVISFVGFYVQEYQRQIYQGTSTSGTLLQTITTCYNGAASPCNTIPSSPPITQKSVTWNLPGSTKTAKHFETYDASYGMSTESDDYDYGNGSPGPLLKKTSVTYQSLGTYLNAFKKTVTIQDASGAVKYRQDSNYDQYSGFTGSNCLPGVSNHDDSGFGCSVTSRANLTSLTTYINPAIPSGGITKNLTYDSLGNLRTAQLNCCQLKTFVYSSATAYAYPDSVTSGSGTPSLTSNMTYDLNMGRVLTATDPNNVKTTLVYDNLGRPLTVTPGSNPATQYTYSDSGNWSAQVCAPVQGTNTVCQKSILDTLGRVVTTQLLDGTGTLYSASDVKYDSFGRAYKTSNPYISSPAYWTQLSFDTMGRPVQTTLPDNSGSHTAYTDNTITTTDAAGIQRQSVIDGLGRLISVYEPDPTNNNSLTLQTSYAYNVLNQLTQVTQGSSQTRNYAYDALGRPLSSSTPEAGIVCFGSVSGSTCNADGYDSFDNLLKKTDARGVQTNYIYDALNRVIGLSYSNVPSTVSAMPNVCATSGSTNNANVCFTYGTTSTGYVNGRAVQMTDPSGSESYTYDQFGNVTTRAKNIGSTVYNTSYAYNYASQLTQITYPSGRAVAQNLDTIGRLSSVVGTLNSINTTYASGFLYNAAQLTTGLQYGNNLYASFGFNADTLLLKCLDYSTTNRNGTCVNDSTTKFGLQYNYAASPNNNGLISSTADNSGTQEAGRSATYAYDTLYRLISTVTTGSTNYPKWGLSETYDRYGNRFAQTVSAGSGPPNSVMIDATTNRITGSPYSYDLSGNMTNDGLNTLTYDGVNHVTNSVNGSNSGTYTYDGNGIRVKKVSVVSGTSTTTVYVFSGAKVIAEYDNGAAVAVPSREYIYSGGRRIATIQGSTTTYQHSDHLSVRIITDGSGNVVGQRGHYPYGESWYETGTLTKVKFTTYERDSESGNDFAMDRTYVNRLGRFSSVDPLGGNKTDPQSLNGYSYSLNDPINLVDPTGDYSGSVCINDICQLGGPGGGGGSGGGGGTGPICTLDGVETDCGTALNTLNPGDSGPLGILMTPTGTQHIPDDSPDCLLEGVCGPGENVPVFGNVSLGPLFGQWVDQNTVAPWEYRKYVVDILKGKNKCADWFNKGTMGSGAALNIISNNPILRYQDELYVGATSDGLAPYTIYVNTQGPFYPSNPFKIGGFKSGSFEARLIILLHELAHIVYAPGFNQGDIGGNDSQKNTELLLTHCLDAILGINN